MTLLQIGDKYTKLEEKAKMENETKQKTIDTFGSVSIGEDVPQLMAKEVIMEDYRFEDIDFNGKVSKKLVLLCKHPDVSDKLIEISGAKYEVGDKLKCTGLWWKLDNDGKIPYNSSIAHVMRFKGATTLDSMKGMYLETALDDGKYLVVRAY